MLHCIMQQVQVSRRRPDQRSAGLFYVYTVSSNALYKTSPLQFFVVYLALI